METKELTAERIRLIEAIREASEPIARADVLAMTFHCAQCHNAVEWTPHMGVECPFCDAELFTEDGEINGY